MAQQVTLGGDRIGSGNKQKVELHNYQMNSFNLEQDWKSSMAPGILYPFCKLVGTNHGTFDIDLDTFVRTLPTKGPLFGSFKLQLDIYNVPIRLYQGILHNNPIGIGLKMNQVYLPKLNIKTMDGMVDDTPKVKGSTWNNRQCNESALLRYLGFGGVGSFNGPVGHKIHEIGKKINAIPALAYYDIFKCYYSNKQEEYAYVITPSNIRQIAETITVINTTAGTIGNDGTTVEDLNTFPKNDKASLSFVIAGKIEDTSAIDIIFHDDEDVIQTNNLKTLINDESANIQEEGENTRINIKLYDVVSTSRTIEYIELTGTATQAAYTADIALTPFKLANIDEMRNRLLSNNTLGQEFVIDNETDLMPYSALVNRTDEGITWNAFIDNGLVVKTYQSDLFNNWLDSEMIDGENGISTLSAVAVNDGSFTIDSLNFAQKVYEVLNRVAVSGGTYEDWQEAVYGEGAVRKAETPMYVGGMAAEIMFEEVVASTAMETTNDKMQALGSLGGKGTQVGQRGGRNIHIRCDEPSYIIGIVSITPRIAYSQGNDWDLTELDTLDDLHKPGLDGIGFQDLMCEQMAWWSTKYNYVNGQAVLQPRMSAGKQTAWINYQTAVDKCYGDFAREDGYAFMVLNRNYEHDERDIKDLTTYIDPSKFNYAFAYTDLAAQNFWVQIHSKIIARRKMGAQQIPNL